MNNRNQKTNMKTIEKRLNNLKMLRKILKKKMIEIRKK